MNFHIEITSPIQFLCLLCSVIGVVGLSIFPLFRSQRDTAVKVFGGLLVAGIGFGAASAWIYPITIFIVATLVTELEFLEKLAAIVWNRKEYWQYLMSKASPSEIKRKVAQDLRQMAEHSVSTVPKKTQSLQEALSFETAAMDALVSKNPFDADKVETSVSITGEGRKLILDAIVESPDTTYIIEIKASDSSHVFDRGIHQLRMYTNTFRKFAEERGKIPHIVPVLVVPTTDNLPNARGEVLILKFDKENGRFTNVDEVRTQLNKGGDSGDDKI